MRTCDDCNECCNGILTFEDNNIIVTDNKKCFKLVDGNCSIYETRPKTCKDFLCTFLLDEGLPDWLRPNKCGFILSEREDRIILSQCKNISIDNEALLWIIWWTNSHRKTNLEMKTFQYGNYMFTFKQQ